MKKILYLTILLPLSIFYISCQQNKKLNIDDYNNAIIQILKHSTKYAANQLNKDIKEQKINFKQDIFWQDTSIIQQYNKCIYKLTKKILPSLLEIFTENIDNFTVENPYSLLKGDNILLPNQNVDSMSITHYFELIYRDKIVKNITPQIQKIISENKLCPKKNKENLNSENIANKLIDNFLNYMQQAELNIRRNNKVFYNYLYYENEN